MSTGFVVSDLHLLSHRSDATGLLSGLFARSRRCDFFIFNGDTFDFAWTSEISIEVAIERAEGILRQFCSEAPECHFFYVMGNHDHVGRFLDLLSSIERDFPNFSLHWDILQLGTLLFLHGDVCNREMSFEDLRAFRALYVAGRKRHPVHHWIYSLIILLRLNRIVYLTHPKETMVQRVFHYLKSRPIDLGRVTDVFFGHTHVAFRDFLFQGIRFHNTGSSIRGLKAQFQELSLPLPVSEYCL